ncbi:MAG: sarcosine oxidase subunit alpha family protein [Pseudomonadota bacterium]
MSQINRLKDGQIERSETLHFYFDGKRYSGHPGDTLASALLANGVRLMGRSFKYHRPRGPFSSGSEEPNALVTLRDGARAEPNTRATTAELFDGLTARSQNHVGSLRFDMMAINDRLARFLTAGFYYKTFMWPAAFWEKLYEPLIRRSAGLGALSALDDPDAYDKGFLHCDLLVVGAGPAGLATALLAGRSGAEVILADEDFRLGGRFNAETGLLTEENGVDWAARTVAELTSMEKVRIMPRTTVIGAFDHGIFGAVERVSDHLGKTPADRPRQILWRIHSKRSILAAGATERSIAFANNDRPGIMLASALGAFANRWAVTPSRRAAIFTNNDSGHRVAADLLAKGIGIAGVIDTRDDAPVSKDFEVFADAQVLDTSGRHGLRSIKVRDGSGKLMSIECGALGVSGGWNPNVHLSCHHGGKPVWNDELSVFVPGPKLPQGMTVIGAAAGRFSTHEALASGVEGATDALGSLGLKAQAIDLPEAEDAPVEITPFWHVGGDAGRAWIDQQNDVTVKDISLAYQEGFRAVEHLKRYTTLGMATDQGKTSNVAGLAIMAEIARKEIPEVGSTVYRPPYTPVAIGAFAGRARGKDFRPTRLTPSHDWAKERGAVFVEAGNWMRAQYFPTSSETNWRQTVDREALAVRTSVGVCDVTTLGKVDVQGSDAAEFLNLVYANGVLKLRVGKTRYGIMLREDGIVMDDGTAARLAETHFVVTTTTANAVPVYRHMEFVRQCLCPAMDVQLMSTTEAWAQFTVAGPRSREVLAKIVDQDLSNGAFPFMACANVTVSGGLRARLFRISFSGELAYEIAVPTPYGDALIRRIMEAGEEFQITPYGIEALGVLRIEKGHPTGNELNGTTTALNLGLGRMVSRKKDCIGKVLSRREGLNTLDALNLIGIRPLDPETELRAGGHLMALGGTVDASHDQGYVTSACYSPNLRSHIALAYLKSGGDRLGEHLRLVSPLTRETVEVEVVSPHFVDPEGSRLRE